MAEARAPVPQADSNGSRSDRDGKARSASAGRSVVIHSGEDVAEVPVSRARFKQIVTRQGSLGKLIAGYADSAAEASRTGRSFRVSVVVTPDGRVETVSAVPADMAVAGPLDAAIARAKARGAIKAADILKGPDMLTARDFGLLIGASHETVNAKRKRNEVLGLEGSTRGVKYPRWQVTDAGLLLPGLVRLFGTLGGQPWTVFRFLLTDHAELGGRTALDALKSGQVDAVVGVAENSALGAFS